MNLVLARLVPGRASRVQGTNKPTNEVTTELRFYLLPGIRGCGLGGRFKSARRNLTASTPGNPDGARVQCFASVTVYRPSEQMEYNLKDGGNATGYG